MIVVVFTLSGTAVGIASGMLFGRTEEEYWRVSFDTSVPLAFFGAIIGGMLGLTLRAVQRKIPRAKVLLDVISSTVLAAAIGGTTGWLVGDIKSANHYEHRRLTPRLMAAGAGSGLLVGLILGIIHSGWQKPGTGR